MSWAVWGVWGVCAALWGAAGTEEVDFSTVDVRRLATHVYGTELFLLENRYSDQTQYKFEDFFWTGSGEGPDDEESHWTSDNPPTVYKTKTVVTTVFIESPQSTYNETSDGSSNSKCKQDCQTSTATPEEEIHPTKTFRIDSTISEEDFSDADQQFWLVTILRSNGKDPVINDLKNSLAKLYKIAFQRQQERHLGITNVRLKRSQEDTAVNVFIHDVKKNRSNGDEDMEVVYHVSVDGKPVPAVTAANDMALVTDVEVKRALGYSTILTKAEPYMKPSEPQSLSSAKNTWIFIGVSISALLVCLLVVAFLILGCAKKKKPNETPTSGMGLENRQHIFERGVGHDNKGYSTEGRKGSPTYVNYKNENSTLGGSVVATSRPGSSISSTSTSSASLDISPLMSLKKPRRIPPKKPLRTRAGLNKTVPMDVRRYPCELFDSDSSNTSRKESPDHPKVLGNYDPGVVSPKSYLSMPSVKSFPRSIMPEPLNKVLEPVSIHHLDMPDDDSLHGSQKGEKYCKGGLARHSSLGTVEDPGVIGPIVWNMHCQRLQHGVSVDEGMNDMSGPTNITKMRKRFHDLLDDTFSLFGSTRGSPGPEQSHSVPIEVKSHSAVDSRPSGDLRAPTPKPRPKTSDLRHADRQRAPRGAWASAAPTPPQRPLSAGVVNPRARVNVDHVLAGGGFGEGDPAVPLIAAIRAEIERVSLPGSTHNLNG